MAKLTVKKCDSLSEPSKYSDGGGLYLLINAKGAKYWRAAYRFNGKQKTASFGVYPTVSLKDARAKHAVFKAELLAGVDPTEQKKAMKQEASDQHEAIFSNLAKQWRENTGAARNWTEKHHGKVQSQLNNHILPVFGDRDIRTLRPIEIVELVQSIDNKGITQTAHDCLDIIRRICAYAVQLEIRETSPAAHLKDILSKVKSEPMKHMLDPQRLGEIILILERANATLAATKAYIRLMPMLFTRPTELRMMRWDEYDRDKALLTIPAERMKKRRDHIIPLPTQAIAIIEGMTVHTGHYDHIFTNPATGKPISEGAAQRLKIRNGLHAEITWHGWRHTASTLLNEQEYNSDHIEKQLSHKGKDGTRHVYNHAVYVKQRREMLQKWADYLDELKAKAMKQ